MTKNLFSLKNLIWFCAIGLAVFSGYYSVFGISKLFSGGSWSIIGMAAMLELSKLVVVTFLHDHFKTLRLLFKGYLLSAAVVLMAITSIGVYGYLTNSYQETAKTIYKAQNEMVLLDQKKKLFEEQKIQIDKAIEDKNNRLKSLDQIRVSQQNAYTEQLTQKRGTSGLSKNISSIDKSSESLNNDISVLTQKSFALADSIAKIDQTKLTVTNESFSSELGPLLYLSRITGIPMDNVVNWFILILVIVFDPLAVSLVIAANHLSSKEKQKKSLEELSEIGQEIGIGYEEPTQSFPSSVNGQITDSVTQGVVEVTDEENPDFFHKEVSLEENDIEQDMIKILPEESVINVNEFVREEPEVEIALGDIINEDTKDDLLISEEISILNNESQNEQNEFYQEEPKKKKPKQAVIEQPTYTRGISV
jgi:hypothetical protein